MKKTLLWQLLMLLIPFAVSAQEATVVTGFTERLEALETFKLNDELYVTAAILKNNVSQITAVNSGIQKLWRTDVQGTAMAGGTFKGMAYIVASLPGTPANALTYTCYFLDMATGKVINSKLLYTTTNAEAEVKVFSGATGRS